MRRLATLVLLLSAFPEGAASQRILIVFHSETGHTAQLADAVAAGARSVMGAEVRLMSVDRVSTDDLIWSDALIVGSPVHSANVSAPIMGFLESLPFNGEMRDKIGAAFVTAGGISAGEEAAQLAILRGMLIYNMIIVGGPTWTEAFGASAVTAEPPFGGTPSPAAVDSMFLAKGTRLGARVAEAAILLRGRAGPLLALHAGSFEARPGWEAVRVGGEGLYIDPRPIASDADIASVQVTRTREGMVLDVQLTEEGGGRLAGVTARNVGQPIVVMFRSRAVTAPVIRSAIEGGRMQIVVPADSVEETKT